MSDHIPGLVLLGKHGTTPYGDFWRLTSGTMALYNKNYPRGCVMVDADDRIIADDGHADQRGLEAVVRAHLTTAKAAIAAGQFTEHTDEPPATTAPDEGADPMAIQGEIPEVLEATDQAADLAGEQAGHPGRPGWYIPARVRM
jgi:hypothetical protein